MATASGMHLEPCGEHKTIRHPHQKHANERCLLSFYPHPINMGSTWPPALVPALTAAVENADFVSLAEIHVEDKAVAGEDGAGTTRAQHHLRHVLQV